MSKTPREVAPATSSTSGKGKLEVWSTSAQEPKSENTKPKKKSNNITNERSYDTDYEDMETFHDNNDSYYGFRYYAKEFLKNYLPNKKSRNEEEDLLNDDDSRSAKQKTSDFIKKTKKLIKYPERSIHYYIVKLLQRPEEPVDYEFIEKLIRHDADINFQNKYGDTCLIEICKFPWENKKVLELFEYFLQRKADINLVNLYGHTVLHTAASKSNDNLDLVKCIFNCCQKTMIDATTHGEEQTLLHYAARGGNVKIARYLILEKMVKKEVEDHLGRTPLYVAAEYGQTAVVKALKELGCKVDVSNKYGQKALFWIVSKCPEICSEILDEYIELNRYSGKQIFHLQHLEVEPNAKIKSIPDAKSIVIIFVFFFYISGAFFLIVMISDSKLTYIVEAKNLEVIVHPVISKLIQVKWNEFGRINAYTDLALTVANIVIWNLLATLTPYQSSFQYDLQNDWWRILLFVLGVLGIFIILLLEVKEVIIIKGAQAKCSAQRLQELSEDRRYCHPYDNDQKEFLKEERKAAGLSTLIESYIFDLWNIYDLLSVAMLLIVVFTHVGDILNPQDATTRAYGRVFSVTIIVISLRLFETGRVIYERFGMLVVTLSYMVTKIIVWFLVYCIFWLSFTSAFWMIFGGRQLSDESDADYCATVTEPVENCTYLTVSNMGSYNQVAFTLWLVSFGRQFNIEKMTDIDPIMSSLLIGFYIGICTILLINMFIAFIVSTLDRVYNSARAYFLLLRAQRLINNEHSSSKTRIRHLLRLKTSYMEKITYVPETKDAIFDNLVHAMRRSRGELANLKHRCEEFKENVSDVYQSNVGPTNRARLLQRSISTIIDAQKIEANRDELGKLVTDIHQLKSHVKKLLKE